MAQELQNLGKAIDPFAEMNVRSTVTALRDNISGGRAKCWIGLLLGLSVSSVILWPTIRSVSTLSFQDERYSHLILIPAISLCLIYLDRRRIFANLQPDPLLGTALLLIVFAASQALKSSPWVSLDAQLALATLEVVLAWIAIVALCLGRLVIRAAKFQLLFMLLMVPIPAGLLEHAVATLQSGSSNVAYAFFRLGGIPVARHGFQMSLSTIDIEVARECSGIRSCISLFITGLLAGHLLLQTGWHKLVVVLLSPLIAVFDNGLRVVTIALLGVYVDPKFFHGSLHKYGGIPFSLLSLAILMPLVMALRAREAHSRLFFERSRTQ